MEQSTLWLLLAGYVIILGLLPLAFLGSERSWLPRLPCSFGKVPGGGVLGTMLMLALWIFALPVMAVIALVVGLFALAETR